MESGSPRHTEVMGSFTELTLSFTFSDETPPEVIGAFAEWRTGDGAPGLPTLEDVSDSAAFDADEHLGGYFGDDPMESLALPERAAMWRYLMGWRSNAYFPGTPATALRWDQYGNRWTLTTRTLPKEIPEWVKAIIAPLGEWATEGAHDRPRFVGYILDEITPRPVLMWSVGRESFRFEGEFDEA
jgi:hypothetical protein